MSFPCHVSDTLVINGVYVKNRKKADSQGSILKDDEFSINLPHNEGKH